MINLIFGQNNIYDSAALRSIGKYQKGGAFLGVAFLNICSASI
jgi:hypothetical protein